MRSSSIAFKTLLGFKISWASKLKKWGIYAKQVRSLCGRLGFKFDPLSFLGYVVEIDSGEVYDEIKGVHVDNPETLYVLLAHYSKAEPIERTGRLVRFRDLPGGYAYEDAFMRRAVFPLAETFGNYPEMLLGAAKVLNGTRLSYGDVSVEIPALPKVPLTYVLWKRNEEFELSASVFFDASASNYLPTEDLAVLAELTTLRLGHVGCCEKGKLG